MTIPPSHDDQIERLIDAVDTLLTTVPWQPERLCVRSGRVSIELTWPGTASSSQQPANGRPAAASEPGSEAADYICAPSVGTFYQAPAPGRPPFVAEGDVVRPGQQVAIIEAMKLMLPVEAEYACQVEKVLKRSGDPVEFGEPLMHVVRAEAG